MAELFVIRFNVGAEAPISVVAGAVADLGVLAGAAMEVATSSAEHESRRYLADLVASEGVRALVSYARRREVGVGQVFERDMSLLEQEAEEFDIFLREYGPPFFPRRFSKRYGYAPLLWSLFTPGRTSPWGGTPWEPIFQQLVAAETAERLPRHSYRVRTLTYTNPITVEVISAAGGAAAALAYLLRVIATLGPRRRREAARADAEERIQDAYARDVEDRVECRIELRRFLLDRINSGEINLRPEDITDAFLDEIEGAASRLADRDITFEREQIASDTR